MTSHLASRDDSSLTDSRAAARPDPRARPAAIATAWPRAPIRRAQNASSTKPRICSGPDWAMAMACAWTSAVSGPNRCFEENRGFLYSFQPGGTSTGESCRASTAKSTLACASDSPPSSRAFPAVPDPATTESAGPMLRAQFRTPRGRPCPRVGPPRSEHVPSRRRSCARPPAQRRGRH